MPAKVPLPPKENALFKRILVSLNYDVLINSSLGIVSF